MDEKSHRPGMAFLSTYIHDLFRLDYSEWTLFVGILILGIAVDRLSKPSYKKKFSYKVSKEHEREIFAKTLFSESVQVVTSQNLETVYANADFGRLTLDLRQAQFMTDRPQIVVQANFSQVIIRYIDDDAIFDEEYENACEFEWECMTGR